MRTPADYAARAAAWHPPPSPACVADVEGAVREAMLDAAELAERAMFDAASDRTEAGWNQACVEVANALRRVADLKGGG